MESNATTFEAGRRAWRWGHLALVLAVGLSWLALAGMNFWMGELNQDEGWYLYAAGQIREGRMPYRDFAFTQPPLMPLVYSWGYGWVERMGVAGGRALTGLFGATGLLAAVWLALRMAPRDARRLAAGLAFILAGVNVYQTYFTVVVKTYALSGLFLAGGLLALSFVGRRSALRAAVAAGFLLACAAGTRITMGAALATGGLYLLAVRRHLKAWAWLDFGLGGLLGLAVIFLPFMAIGGEGFRFGIAEYHTLRDPGPGLVQAAYKIGCLSRLARAYFPAVAVGLFLAVAGLASRFRCRAAGDVTEAADEAPAGTPPGFAGWVWATVAVLGLVHLAAPFPYDDYQVPVVPVFCAVLAAAGARWWVRMEKRPRAACPAETRSARRLAILTGLWLLCGLYAFSSPRVQDWFTAGRDRIWWRLRGQSPMAQLRDMGAWVRALTEAEGGTELLTQDTYLAVEAHLPVPHGLEMGPFSYYPDWPRERAEAIGVVNREMLADLLAEGTNAPIAALSGYSLAIRSPEVEAVELADRQLFDQLLETHFDRVESVPGFGQAGTTLEIWRRKAAPETDAGAE